MSNKKDNCHTERGAGLFEYVILVAMICIVVIVAVKSLSMATYKVTMKNADAIACSGSYEECSGY